MYERVYCGVILFVNPKWTSQKQKKAKRVALQSLRVNVIRRMKPRPIKGILIALKHRPSFFTFPPVRLSERDDGCNKITKEK